jgi:3-hydroxyisobutyrate dehydrogenase/glyoxylate/succinic semialdehyde reductase
MNTIGCIGLGIMGSRMARNLQKAGHSLIVYNRTQEKAQELVSHGATLANSILEVAQQSDIVITMLSTPEIVLEIAQGKNGLLQNLKSDALWINSSTIHPSAAKELGSISEQHKVRYLDAPVAGTKGPAEAGELLFLVGGNSTDLEAASPLLDILGKKTLHLGEVGAGSSMKLLINQLLGQQMVAFAEALSMGTQMGIAQETLFNVLLATPVVAPVMAAVRPKLENEHYEANFPLKWIHKDLHLSSITAYEHQIATPNLNATKEVFAQAKKAGFGDLDFTAVYEFLRY